MPPSPTGTKSSEFIAARNLKMREQRLADPKKTYATLAEEHGISKCMAGIILKQTARLEWGIGRKKKVPRAKAIIKELGYKYSDFIGYPWNCTSILPRENRNRISKLANDRCLLVLTYMVQTRYDETKDLAWYYQDLVRFDTRNVLKHDAELAEALKKYKDDIDGR